MANELRLNDVGVPIRFTMKEPSGTLFPIDGATTLTVYLKKPSGSLLTKTAALYTDGTDAKLQYVLVTGDLDELGSWQAQAYVDKSGYKVRSKIVKFKVEPILT